MARQKKYKVETTSFEQAMTEIAGAKKVETHPLEDAMKVEFSKKDEAEFRARKRKHFKEFYEDSNKEAFSNEFLYEILVRDYAKPSCARSMESAVPELRTNRQFILDVLKHRRDNRVNQNDKCDCCFPFIDKKLQDDKEIALLALEMDKDNRSFIGPTLRKDKNFILKAIELCGWLICDTCDISFFSDTDFLKKVHKVEYDAPLSMQMIQLDPVFYENKTSADVFIARRLAENK